MSQVYPIFPPMSKGIDIAAYDAGAIWKQDYGKHRPRNAGVAAGSGATGARRGRVVGFSAASRARLRQWLVKAEYSGRSVAGITLTIPGINLVDEMESDRVFGVWCERQRKAGIPVIWRKEIQARGALHWHCIAWADKRARGQMVVDWWDCVRLLGEYRGPVKLSGEMVECVASSRMALAGAAEHAAKVEDDMADSERAMRYICDHASKRKQAQSQTCGRAWGIVCRKQLPLCSPSVARLAPAAVDQFVRLCRRLYAYRVPAKCVFGCRVERRSNRRLRWRGEHALIGHAASVARLVDWCNATS